VRQVVEAALQGAGVAFDLALTEGPGHAIELARAAKQQGYAVVAAAGGDGTISEVVNGLVQAAPGEEVAGRLAVLPTGTGNDFAAMIGASKKLDRAAQAIAQGSTQRIDVGVATVRTGEMTLRRYFDNNMGIGLEAAVTIESYKLKRLSGTMLYLTAAVRTVFKMHAPLMRVEWQDADGKAGQRERITLIISVGNSARTGGGFYLTPSARLDDGLLDVAMADEVSTLSVFGLLPRALNGSHTTHPVVTMLRVRRLQVAIPEGAPVQMDGEVVAEAARAVEIGLLPAKLDVVAAQLTSPRRSA
jgi:YegS/Rv2252/BmrU family lipid kinase